MSEPRFDVFLSHNGRDKPVVERIARRLQLAGLEPWLDVWCLTPGGRWQQELADGMDASASCAVFVGPSDLGSWELQELEIALDRAARDRTFRLFPVLLPGLPEQFDATTLPPFLATRTWVDFRSGWDDTRRFQALVNAIKGVPLGAGAEARRDGDRPPYRGLEVFEEEHADLFFGRDADVQRLLEKLKGTRFLLVVGASGSGKSSLVRAGLVPALRRGALPGSEAWTLAVVRPGAHPLTALAAQLATLAPGSRGMQQTLDGLADDERTLHLASALALAGTPEARVLWVVDQLEEAFTLTRDDAERRAFLANLAYAGSIPDGQTVIVATMRADFYPRLAEHADIAQLAAANQFLVAPLDEEGLRQAIEEPARLAGLELEAGLVDTVVEDVEHQPGALPLLEHALLELWRRRRGTMLTLEGYRETGGVSGALALRADAVYESLSPEQREVARRTFLRLTQPGEGTEDTRRRASLRELHAGPDAAEDVDEVIRALVDARMLTSGGDDDERWIDVSHEALIRGWPRLRDWLDDDRAGLRLHRRLTEAANEWQRLGRDEGTLYRGARLAEATEWRAHNADRLNELERSFLDAGAALRLRERRQAQRRVRVTIAGLTVALVVIGAVAALAVRSSRIASEQRDVAFSREVAARALAQLPTDPELGMLLALEALRIEPTDAADDALRQAFGSSHLETVLRGHRGAVWSVAASRDGRLLTAGEDGTARLWDADGRATRVLRGHRGSVAAGALSGAGRVAVTGGADGTARIWDTESGRALAVLRHGAPIRGVAVSPDGRLVATAGVDALARIWRVAGGRPVQTLRGHGEWVDDVAFSADGRRIVTAGGDRTARVWDVGSGEQLAVLRGHTSFVSAAAFAPDGRTVVTASDDRTARLWDVASGRTTHVLRGHTDPLWSAAFSPDGRLVVTAGGDKSARVWDVAAGRTLVDLRGHTTFVLGAVFVGGDETVATVGGEGVARVWRVDAERRIALLRGHRDRVTSAAFSPAGERLATGGRDGTVRIWRARDGRELRVLRGHRDSVESVAFTDDGETLVSGGLDGAVRLWEASTGRSIRELGLLAGGVRGTAAGPDGLVAAVGQDGTTLLWNTAERTEPTRLAKERDRVEDVAFSADGGLLATAGFTETATIFDVASRKRTRRLAGESPLWAVAFGDGDRLIAAAGEAGVVRIWDARTGRRVRELRGHTSRVGDVDMTADGRFVATASIDGTARIWDRATGVTLAQLRGPGGELDAVAFGPNGTRLVVAGAGGAAAIYACDVCRPRDELAAAARQRVTRQLTDEERRLYLP